MKDIITLKPHEDYYYQKPYFLINGDESLAADVVLEMRQSGIEVEHYARSKYPARNNRQYDWFIKTLDSPDLDHIFGLVDRFNRKLINGREQKLEDQAELKKRYRELQAQLCALRDQSVAGQAASTETREKEKKLREELELFEKDNQELTSTIKIQDELLNEASQDQAQLRQELQSARDKIKRLEKQLNILEDTLQPPVPTPKQTGIEVVLNSIWPEVTFLRDSILRIEMEYNLNSIMPRLRGIIERKERGKPVRSVSNWHEIHCSTGQSDDGRIYFTYSDVNEPKSRKILVSRKDRQKTDFDYLKSQ